MKKILLASVLFALAISSCIKKDATVSATETASFPTITISSGLYYSVVPNALYPPVTASATDSFYNPTTFVVIDSAIHTNIPGLYLGTVTAENKKGFISYENFYVAVTAVPATMDLSGTWWPAGNTSGDSATHIVKLANGLYSTTNIGGVADTSSALTSGIFAVLDAATIVFAPPTSNSYISPGALSMIPADTTISYMDAVTGATITFKKQ